MNFVQRLSLIMLLNHLMKINLGNILFNLIQIGLIPKECIIITKLILVIKKKHKIIC